jgi:hypothetical protein
MKTRLACLVSLVLAAPAAAGGAGPPVSGLDGRVGALSADGGDRFVAFVSGDHSVVARLHTAGADVARSRTIRGRYVVPAVANDNSGGGLSHDGGTLVLVNLRRTIPQKTTSLAVLDARRLRVTRTITLRGDFSFDAISPDGSTAYLVQYLSLGQRNFDPTNYKVRALDIAGGRLLPSPIVDPREPGEKMGGLPITRATSADGRWAYTLYSGSEHPFIHALDTSGRSARCIDLDALTGREDLFQLRLRVADGGRRIDVVKDDAPQLAVDTSSRSVRKPRPTAPPARPAKPATADDGGGSIWPWAAAAAALLALIGAASARPLARMSRAR